MTIAARKRWDTAEGTGCSCSLCGAFGSAAEPNRGPFRYWCPHEGWKADALCAECATEVLDQRPQESDPAWYKRNHWPDGVEYLDWMDAV